MHPFVSAILLGAGRQDPLMLNAQADPPHVEDREAVDTGGGKRHAVIRTNGTRQAVLAKEAIEDGADSLPLSGE